MGVITELVILYGGLETFPGDRLGFKVVSAIEKLTGVEDTVAAKEV